jgi:hypothetical protein
MMNLVFEVADLELNDIAVSSMRDTAGLPASITTDVDSCNSCSTSCNG